MRFVGEKSVAMRALVNVIRNFFRLNLTKFHENSEFVHNPRFIPDFSNDDPFLAISHLQLVTTCVVVAMPEAAELVAAADTLSEASLYTEAISTYTKAIELVPTSPSYYIKRYCASFIND